MDHYIINLWDSFRFASVSMPTVGVRDILDILIVAYLIYKMIFWIKETRAWVLFKGILVIVIFALASYMLRLNTILWILQNTISVGIIAVIVVFQPELRKALEQLGKSKHFFAMLNFDTPEKSREYTEKTVEEIIKASEKMSAARTGALMLIERDVPLGDFERTGINIDAVVTSQLLINIFEKNTPLHDGAVIIKNNSVAAATCFLPLTESNDISMDLGTRHRAAIGASEVSDAFVVVVSEETGAISIANGGVLYRNLSVDAMRRMLLQGKKSRSKKKKIFWRRGKKDE